MDQTNKFKGVVRDLLLNFLGVFFYAVGINSFAAPHKIAPGGASGIAILINYLTGFPIGLFVFVFNIPLLVIIIIKGYFSKEFILKTLGTTFLLSVVTDMLVIHLPAYKGDPLLASMFGGALMGIGLALVHLGSSNTGGISLLGLIIQKLKPQFHVGALMSGLNIFVVLASGIVYKNIESLLYAILTVYISGVFMDRLVNNISAKNLIIVISECTDKVRAIFLNAHKGITILKGEGGYTSETQRVILCAATKADCENIQKSVKTVDSHALIIIIPASKVLGKGFEHLI